MKVLVLFSNPPDQDRLRWDLEDPVLKKLAKQHGVELDTVHACTAEEARRRIADGGYDVIQFSGHGLEHGFYMIDPAALGAGSGGGGWGPHRAVGTGPQQPSHRSQPGGELVTAERLLAMIDNAERPPRLVLFLACYSDSARDTLGQAAPFVITSKCEVPDSACRQFIEAFYESYFRKRTIETSFDLALGVLKDRGIAGDYFQLSRRHLLNKGNKRFLFCKAGGREPIIVNLDDVADRLGSFGIPEAEVCYSLERKLKVHLNIFVGTGDRVTIPIGHDLYGVFSWKDADDVVRCTRIMRMRKDTPDWHWDLWCRVLVSYNDVASCEYRRLGGPADASWKPALDDALRRYRMNIEMCLEPLQKEIKSRKQFENLLSNIGFVRAEVEQAGYNLKFEYYSAVHTALERAQMNFHQIADGLQPPEETSTVAE